MFSGIHSLFSRKKTSRSQIQTDDESTADKSSNENEYIFIERRHSDEPDVNPGLYPSLNPDVPSTGNLPYGISPSLPDLRPKNNVQKMGKEGTVDLLQGVPFQLASYIDIMTNEKDDKFAKFLQYTKDALPEDLISDGYSYDFNLEHRILSEFQTLNESILWVKEDGREEVMLLAQDREQLQKQKLRFIEEAASHGSG